MTASDTPPPPPPEPATAGGAADAPATSWRAALRPVLEPARNLLESLSRAEILILGGALLIVVVDLVFNILIRSYLVSDVMWTAAVALIALSLVQRRRPSALPLPYRSVLVATAGLAALVAARDVVEDLLLMLRPPLGADPAFVIGFVGFALAALLLGAGTWLLIRSDT